MVLLLCLGEWFGLAILSTAWLGVGGDFIWAWWLLLVALLRCFA